MAPTPEPFNDDDLQAISIRAIDAWQAGADGDWSVPAGTLEWTCLATAAHTVDCVWSYALFLASRKTDAYPHGFDELRALPDATPLDMVEHLRAVTNILHAVIFTASPKTRAVIWRRPEIATGGPNDFAARGAYELALHTHDIAQGLGVAFDPPEHLCRRLRDHTANWPGRTPVEPTGDPWSDILEGSGRARLRPR